MPKIRSRGERGAVAVEFALVLPILLSIVFGIIDLGFAINRYAMVNNAVREGVREASLGATESEIRTVVSRGTTDLGGTVSIRVGCKRPDNATQCTSWTNGAESGGTAEVTVELTHGWLTPVGSLIGPNLHIIRTAKMRIE